MTHRFGWLLGFGLAAASAGGCSSSSSSAPVSSEGGGAGDAGTGQDAAAPIEEPPPAAMCDAVSLAPVVDAAAAACFECQASHCTAEIAACSTDCSCAPAYSCLEQNSAEGALSSGYSACPEAIDTVMNGNVALTNLTQCATSSCNPQCYGGAADGGAADGG